MPSVAKKISRKIKTIPNEFSGEEIPVEKLVDSGLVKVIYHEAEDQYLKEYERFTVFKGAGKINTPNLKILYTPLHGTGLNMVKNVLGKFGFSSVRTVPGQDVCCPDFSAAPVPNPEDITAFELALEHAHTINPDIILATDPDCDRVGVMVKDRHCKYRLLTGNQVGALLLDHVLRTLKDHGPICGIELINRSSQGRFLFGYEESCGYLAGDFVRDKDGIMGVLLICQMTAYYKGRGISLPDALENLFQKYGFHSEKLINIRLNAEKEQDVLKKTMETCRRIWPVVPAEKQWIITGENHYFQVKNQVEALKEEFNNAGGEGSYTEVLKEPMGKNTAPAVFWAAKRCLDLYGEECVLVVLPSDHLITKEEDFVKVLNTAVSKAKEGCLVTFGIKPVYPETGYGYIKIDDAGYSPGEVYPVSAFTEKPDDIKAQEYIKSGNYLWNSSTAKAKHQHANSLSQK